MANFLDPNAKLKPGPEVRFKNVKNEAVVIHFTTGNYYVLDPMSAFLWESVSKEPLSFEALLEAVLEEYEADKAAITPDVSNFCRYMLDEKLLELC